MKDDDLPAYIAIIRDNFEKEINHYIPESSMGSSPSCVLYAIYKLLENDNAVYKQMGNAVSVPVIEAVITDLIENNNIFDRAKASLTKTNSNINRKFPTLDKRTTKENAHLTC